MRSHVRKLLVVDDEPNVVYSLEKGLQCDDVVVLGAQTARRGLELVQEQRPDAVLLDVRLPDLSGLEAFDQIRQLAPGLPVIVMTAYGTTDTAIEAMKQGAFDYLLKPVDLQRLRETVSQAFDAGRLGTVPVLFEENGESERADRIVGRCPAMQEVYKAIGRVAPLDMTVLILGESGTGKELVARAIYQHSPRCRAPLVAINCAAIPETLLESELFGHERGAFTGAARRRIGKFEQAHHGTIFLDEIGDMSPTTQAKVLRLLQEQQFERVGGNETIQTDVRVLAATNQNLEALVAAGRFRRDLFYRLNVFAIWLPPLRERLADLPLLIDHFLKICNHKLGKQVLSVAPETQRLLETYSWPGNVRELHSTINYAVVYATGKVLTPDCLPEHIRSRSGLAQLPTSAAEQTSLDLAAEVRRLLADGEPEIYRKVCLAVDHIVLDEVLRHVKGNQVLASELLGISRTTLRAKLRALGLAVEKQCALEADLAEQDGRHLDL